MTDAITSSYFKCNAVSKKQFRCKSCNHIGVPNLHLRDPGMLKTSLGIGFRRGGLLGGIIGAAVLAAIPDKQKSGISCAKCKSTDIEVLMVDS